ncbi:MAG: hypothetical protein EXR44_05430 [Dehalococcoidia bacterium]|nr:hypothetical protein [Dehalococcoidia bacterium]
MAATVLGAGVFTMTRAGAARDAAGRRGAATAATGVGAGVCFAEGFLAGAGGGVTSGRAAALALVVRAAALALVVRAAGGRGAVFLGRAVVFMRAPPLMDWVW